MKTLSTMGFGFMLSILMMLWMGVTPAKGSLILATIGAVMIVINYFVETVKSSTGIGE
jgi:hypothetical protein